MYLSATPGELHYDGGVRFAVPPRKCLGGAGFSLPIRAKLVLFSASFPFVVRPGKR